MELGHSSVEVESTPGFEPGPTPIVIQDHPYSRHLPFHSAVQIHSIPFPFSKFI
jgi:hypothetical protein